MQRVKTEGEKRAEKRNKEVVSNMAESAQDGRHGVGKGSPPRRGQPFSTPYRPAQEGHHSVDKGWPLSGATSEEE